MEFCWVKNIIGKMTAVASISRSSGWPHTARLMAKINEV